MVIETHGEEGPVQASELESVRQQVEKLQHTAQLKVQEFLERAKDHERKAKEAYSCADVWRALAPQHPVVQSERPY